MTIDALFVKPVHIGCKQTPQLGSLRHTTPLVPIVKVTLPRI